MRGLEIAGIAPAMRAVAWRHPVWRPWATSPGHIEHAAPHQAHVIVAEERSSVRRGSPSGRELRERGQESRCAVVVVRVPRDVIRALLQGVASARCQLAHPGGTRDSVGTTHVNKEVLGHAEAIDDAGSVRFKLHEKVTGHLRPRMEHLELHAVRPCIAG